MWCTRENSRGNRFLGAPEHFLNFFHSISVAHRPKKSISTPDEPDRTSRKTYYAPGRLSGKSGRGPRQQIDIGNTVRCIVSGAPRNSAPILGSSSGPLEPPDACTPCLSWPRHPSVLPRHLPRALNSYQCLACLLYFPGAILWSRSVGEGCGGGRGVVVDVTDGV